MASQSGHKSTIYKLMLIMHYEYYNSIINIYKKGNELLIFIIGIINMNN